MDQNELNRLVSEAECENVLNREYKDSVFRLVFGEKDKLIELANALFDSDYSMDTPIDINTIEEAIYGVRKNDISFIIENTYIVLSEHQSTDCPNMPARDLIYYAELLKEYLRGKKIYSGSLIRIPRPTFIVFYNGEKSLPPESEMNISDAFLGEGKSSLNLTVKVYNVNKGSGCTLLEKCPTLYQYSQLIQMVRDYLKQGPITHRIMQKIVKDCFERGILVDFMKKYGMRGIEILCNEITQEEAEALSREEGFERGREQGREEGRKEGYEELLDSMMQLNEILKDQDRMEDVKKAMSDKTYMKALLQEFKLL